MGIFWDPVFGWDWDRMRMASFWTAFLFLFTGFISATEGKSFFAPSMFIITFIQSNEIPFIAGTLVLVVSTYWWWRREAGW